MRQDGVALAALQLLLSLVAAQHPQVFKNTPRAALAVDNLLGRRQTPPPGYHPEFGTCGSGTTCENACGPNWESCQASTTLSLFCYNKVDLKQTCCENGSGRACDEGFYCAWQEFGGKVWCCENGQSLEECGVPTTTSSTTKSTTTGPPTSSTATSDSSTTATEPNTSKTSTTSGSTTLSSTTDSQCPASTVTSWATTTVISTVTVGAVTVTVTTNGEGCSGSSSTASSSTRTGPPSVTSATTTVTKPPYPTTTRIRPTNGTITSSIVTGGVDGRRVGPVALVAVLVPLLWR
ncbi:hypothetical protein C8A05DRAFT_31720 [Staphylotrichum tortipilum]|uniref:Uncharacterized protein n=1 Tax=Staphylotrichum tortipilum TaxID=2831512 RepID=A0AAN6MP39_9PEZI|nr:hypothetical protein C8A05DRAFT_31720 [Staphylotrichum longicolle]